MRTVVHSDGQAFPYIKPQTCMPKIGDHRGNDTKGIETNCFVTNVSLPEVQTVLSHLCQESPRVSQIVTILLNLLSNLKYP